jgi:hypothetical protein
MGTGCGAGPRELRHEAQVFHDLLAQFGAGQDRQQLRLPPRHAVVTLLLAGDALTQVACHGQPKGSGQHRAGSPPALSRIAVMRSVGQYLPQFPAPGGLTARIRGSFRRERGDLESAQDRLPVLVT